MWKWLAWTLNRKYIPFAQRFLHNSVLALVEMIGLVWKWYVAINCRRTFYTPFICCSKHVKQPIKTLCNLVRIIQISLTNAEQAFATCAINNWSSTPHNKRYPSLSLGSRLWTFTINRKLRACIGHRLSSFHNNWERFWRNKSVFSFENEYNNSINVCVI